MPKDTNSLIVLGDSITDGRGSDDNKNNRCVDLNVPIQLRPDEVVAGQISSSNGFRQIK